MHSQNCEEFMMMLEEMGIAYTQTPEKIIVDIQGLDPLAMMPLMEHLDMKGVEYAIDETTMYVMPMMMKDVWEPAPRQGNETLALEIDLFARKYIPESDDAFGKFMYHAELIKNGHMDVHQQDLAMVQEPYRSILLQIIEKGGM
jgi:hypothetical protein